LKPTYCARAASRQTRTRRPEKKSLFGRSKSKQAAGDAAVSHGATAWPRHAVPTAWAGRFLWATPLCLLCETTCLSLCFLMPALEAAHWSLRQQPCPVVPGAPLSRPSFVMAPTPPPTTPHLHLWRRTCQAEAALPPPASTGLGPLARKRTEELKHGEVGSA
jgi:hypothetical protein